MKKQILFVVLLFCIFTLHFLSCKKETSCEGCRSGNKPPIANAGPDKVITLPTDSISLNGSNSSDPDGKIKAWLWTKISGPVSFNIVKPTDSITKLKSLVGGTYKFELKVTDNDALSAKDTMQIIVNDPSQPNRPPVANAGADQTITLPTNTVNLDGGGSSDPDNNIINYVWTKISGPSSLTIANTNAAQTRITNLVEGIYRFELKVTDNGGLFSKDTVHIIVNSSVPISSISVLGCNAEMIPFENLPFAAGIVHTAAAANKILFIPYSNNGTVYIYDTTTYGWQTISNMNAVYGQDYNDNATTIGSKIIFSSPNYTGYSQFTDQIINIYNAATNTWSTNSLSEGRQDYTSAVVGSKVFYAGGYVMDSPYVSKKIDIYDAASNSWSSENFPGARIGMKAVSLGNKIYFAGGFITRYDSLVLACGDNYCDSIPAVVASDRIDIWDVNSNTWTLAQLCEPRGNIATTVIGNKIIFASGQNNITNWSNSTTSSKVDIYNAVTNTLTNANLGGVGNNGVIGAYSVGNKVLINYLVSDKVDIYDAANNSWSLAQMPQPLISSAQERTKAAVIGNKILFYTIFTTEWDSKNVDMYDAVTNQWCHSLLSKGHVRAGVISYGNRIYIAGGWTDTGLGTVWFFNF